MRIAASDIKATRRVLEDLFGPPEERPFAVRLGDSIVDAGRADARFALVLNHAGALRRMLVPPTELSIIEAYLYDDADIEGDLEAAAQLGDLVASRLTRTRDVLRVMRHVAALPTYDRPEPDASRVARALQRFGRQHSRRRDRRVVQFHYDLGNDFFALFLDRRMVYSCAYFEDGNDDLDEAQLAKLDYICRKLRLRAGDRFLDVGCGWGALVMHAAERYGVEAVGITLSERQASLARERIAAAGLSATCRVELRDVESLREHYTRTLRHWIRRLERHHERAVELVGEFTYRVWRLYMSGSAYAFDAGRIGIIQTLLAKQGPGGAVSLPHTRRDLYDERGRD